MCHTNDRVQFLLGGQLKILGCYDFMAKIHPIETMLVVHIQLSNYIVGAESKEGSLDDQLVVYPAQAAHCLPCP